MKRVFRLFLCIILASGGIFLTACKQKEERTQYTMQLSLSNEQITGEMTVSVYNGTEDPFYDLLFALPANAYREGAKTPAVSQTYAPAVYYDGESYGFTSMNGASLPFTVEEDCARLRMPLSEPLFPDERVQVSLSFTTVVPRANHRLGVGEHAVNLSYFYPLLCPRVGAEWVEYSPASFGDPLQSDCADYEITLDYPTEYQIAHAGEELERGAGRVRILMENARDFACVMGREMQVISDTVGGISVAVCAFGQPCPDLGLQVAKDALAFYSAQFGEYTRTRFVLAVTDFPHGGMEYTGFAMLSNRLRESELPLVVAHEVAHQWWQIAVGSDQAENAWQDEGLAEFSTSLFMENHAAYGRTGGELLLNAEREYRAYFSLFAQLKGETDTSMTRPLSAYAGEYEYENIAYKKGHILFDRLQSYLGERCFFEGLRGYVKEYTGKRASVSDLASRFPSERGTEAFLRSFVDGKCVI